MALFLAGSAVFGFETDQFMTWSVELEDSAPAINEFVNHYMYYRWRLVRPILQQEVCPRRNGAVVRARFERYQEIAHASPAMNIIEQFYTEWGRRPQDRHSLANLCSRTSELSP